MFLLLYCKWDRIKGYANQRKKSGNQGWGIKRGTEENRHKMWIFLSEWHDFWEQFAQITSESCMSLFFNERQEWFAYGHSFAIRSFLNSKESDLPSTILYCRSPNVIFLWRFFLGRQYVVYCPCQEHTYCTVQYVQYIELWYSMQYQHCEKRSMHVANNYISGMLHGRTRSSTWRTD